MIGSRVTVGHNALVHGAVVLEGMEIPPSSFVVGIPGKVRGQIREEQLKRIEDNALVYVKRAREYKEQGY